MFFENQRLKIKYGEKKREWEGGEIFFAGDKNILLTTRFFQISRALFIRNEK